MGKSASHWQILNPEKITDGKIREKILLLLLQNRGIKEEEREEFFNPSLARLNFKTAGLAEKELQKATERIKKAIAKKESVTVYTDYDADGICAGAIVWETLYQFGAKVLPYVPHRMTEGYGLSKIGLDFIKKEHRASLVITVDHGVSAASKIDYARELGMDVIVLDHHLMPTEKPKCVALVHTTKLAAAGIALLFSRYFSNQICGETDKDHFSNLDLAAFATVADMVPLVGINRVIVKNGLAYLNKTERLGLNALIKAAGLEKGRLGTYEVGHILAPRINAMGRLTHAIDALRLLCTKDPQRASQLVQKLNFTNRERQILAEQATIHAFDFLSRKKGEKLIFACNRNYPEGIIGLVAGKLAEKFCLPAVVVSEGKTYSKASVRSVNGINIVELIKRASFLLEDLGGHPMAAGFTVKTENLTRLKKELQKIFAENIKEDSLKKELKIDLELDLSLLDMSFFRQIQKMAPFGISNPKPIFATFNLELVKASLVGKNQQHLKMRVRENKNQQVFETVGFGLGHLFPRLSLEKKLALAYSVEEDSWGGKNGLQLQIKDVMMPD